MARVLRRDERSGPTIQVRARDLRALVGLLRRRLLASAPAASRLVRQGGLAPRTAPGPGPSTATWSRPSATCHSSRRSSRSTSKHTLYDDRGWTRGGSVAFKWVERRASTKVFLAKPNTVDRMCFPLMTEGIYSCQIGERVVLNWKRWRDGTTAWPGSRRNFRRMAVNHEVGHRLGQGHRSCGGDGRRAPVMQQQTIDLGGCAANPWPLRREVETLPPAGSGTAAAGAPRR